MKKLLVISMILLFLSISLNAFSIQWTKDIIGGGYPYYPTAIALDTSGQPIVTGFASDGDYAMFTVGLGTFGDSLWSTAFEWNNSNSEHSHGITVSNNNNVILTGDVSVGGHPVFAIVKYKSNNVIDWADTLYAVRSEGNKVTTDDSGNIYATGDIWLTNTTDYCVTVKLDSSGNVIWADTLDSSMTSRGLAIALDSSGDIYVSGYAYRDTVKNYLLMKYHKVSSSSYSLSYARIGNDTTDNYSNALAINAYGNIFMLHNFAADTSYYIKAINPSGGGEYSSSPAFYKEIGNDLAIDSAGGLFVTGLYYGSKKDIFTIKRDTLLSTTPTWGDTLEYSNDSWGQGVKISKDSSIYILARLYNPNAHYYVVKYVTPVHDVGVSSIISPDSGIVTGQYYPITAMINNYGNMSENFSAYAAVYDSSTDSLLFLDTTSVNIGPLSNDTVRLDSFYYEPNHSYKTVVYVNLPDTNASNDTQFVYTTPKHLEVLFVEDAEGHGAPYHPDLIWYIPLVNILGSDSLYWYGPTTDASENGPSLAKMKAADLVIWNAYDYYDDACFTEEDTANINEYLAGGGKIWIIGQDIYYSLYSDKGIKGSKRNSERQVVGEATWIGRVFGVDSVYEDYLGYNNDSTMTIQGTGELAGNPIAVHSDFDTSYDGYLYPDEIFPDTSAYAVLVDPDSSFTIGTITNDSTRAFWAADGRGADPTSGGDWETLIRGMLHLFGISQQGIINNSMLKTKLKKTYMLTGNRLGKLIMFMYKGPSNANISVNDISGREVKLFKSVKSGKNIELNVKPGIYFVRIIGKHVTAKISIIK